MNVPARRPAHAEKLTPTPTRKPDGMHTGDHIPVPDGRPTSRVWAGASISLVAAVTASAAALVVTGSLIVCILTAVVTLACVAAATVMI
ncbi:hypothetical protein [Rhodococcus sp. A14]|uniref:hypothetical protein n=1 Tax=Rhodococcus sp. A14 TaxID=1194106 RepID=UPI00142207BE|nr:hypothetical protein [Rhodococcus sp. A14]